MLCPPDVIDLFIAGRAVFEVLDLMKLSAPILRLKEDQARVEDE